MSTTCLYGGAYRNRIEFYDRELARRFRMNRIRRARQIRVKVLTTLVAIILGIILAFSFSSILSNASEENASVEYKYYKSYEIQQGDTLSSIAAAHLGEQAGSLKEYIEEVCFINHLEKDDIIYSGSYLVIPYYSYELITD